MLLRAAVPGDEGEVSRVRARSWQIGYLGLLPEEYLAGLLPADRAARYRFGDLHRLRAATVVAVEQEAIRGFATIGPCRDADRHASGELYAIYVDPDAWGRGIGRALLNDARDRLSVKGFHHAVLWVLAGNDRAERFYRLDGWRPDRAPRFAEVHGITVDELRYHRALQ